MVNKHLMDGREAAKYIDKYSYWSLLELAKQGIIPHIRIGRRVFFRQDSLDKWLDDLETGGTPKEEASEYGQLRKIKA